MSLSEPARERHSRQMRFAPIGEHGQLALRSSRVLIVGVGSLGASLAQHMVRSGVGELRLADRDYVEWSNLQRQMLFDEDDAHLSLPKAIAAADKLRRIDSSVQIEAIVADLTSPEALEAAAAGCDLVLDGTDNAAVRLCLNDWCFRNGVPLMYGGIAGASGMSAPLVPGETCCLRCLIGGEQEQESGETCDTVGMLSPAVEMVAALQAAEALKWLSGNRGEIRRTLASVGVWPLSLREMRLPGPSASCRICSGATVVSHTLDSVEAAKTAVTAVLCGRDTVQVELGATGDPGMYRRRLEQVGCSVIQNPYLLRAELPTGEGRLVVFPDGRVLVQGTSDPEEALRCCELYLTG
ncbi:thiamine biosynthesis protein ThiF [Paenibacillus herberti]|uniref:Thiamine biosynthesis protein ThiF n=2 Tax=Paenibacillus herberti TaxID=1619309 RepID=A0A229P5M1_9BACL|nr:thiamine biosynthesis protein ThiF [Paenibacillus herberti]